jgi:hypothetical protein
VRALLVAALAVLLLAPAASARSELAVLAPGSGGLGESYGLVGPALAGESLVYGRGGETGLYVSRVDGSGTTRPVGATSAVAAADVRNAMLDASEERVAVSEALTACGDDCRGGEVVLASRVLSAPLSGTFRTIAGCEPTGPACGYTCFSGSSVRKVAVDGTAVAFSDPCRPSRLVVRDDGGSPPIERSLEVAGLAGGPLLAGRYLAWLELERPNEHPTPLRVVVYDWMAEREVYRFTVAGLVSAAIQPDGKVAYAQREGESGARVAWASPEEPHAHPGALFPTPSLQVRIARDLIAVQARSYGSERLATFSVADLAGRELASQSDSSVIAQWDFDGARLAWATRPCERAAVVAWDLADARPPALPEGRCPLPAITTRSTSLSGKTFRIALRCPAKPALGCLGRMRLVARTSRGERYGLGIARYEVAPGATGALTVNLSKARRAFVRRHRRVTVAATAIGESRSGLDIAGEFLTRTSSFRLSR